MRACLVSRASGPSVRQEHRQRTISSPAGLLLDVADCLLQVDVGQVAHHEHLVTRGQRHCGGARPPVGRPSWIAEVEQGRTTPEEGVQVHGFEAAEGQAPGRRAGRIRDRPMGRPRWWFGAATTASSRRRRAGTAAGRQGDQGQRDGSLDRRGFPRPRGLSDFSLMYRGDQQFCGSAALRGWGGSGAAAPPVRSGRATAVAGLSVATSIVPSPRAAAHGRLVTPYTVCGNKRGPLVGRGAAKDHAQRDQVTDDAREIGKHVTRSSEETDQEPYRHRGDEGPGPPACRRLLRRVPPGCGATRFRRRHRFDPHPSGFPLRHGRLHPHLRSRPAQYVTPRACGRPRLCTVPLGGRRPHGTCVPASRSGRGPHRPAISAQIYCTAWQAIQRCGAAPAPTPRKRWSTAATIGAARYLRR